MLSKSSADLAVWSVCSFTSHANMAEGRTVNEK